MPKEIKIVPIYEMDYKENESALTAFVNDGWVIVAGGGGDSNGFVVLQRG